MWKGRVLLFRGDLLSSLSCPRWWKLSAALLKPKRTKTHQSSKQALLGDPGQNLQCLQALKRNGPRKGHLLAMFSTLCFTRLLKEGLWDTLRRLPQYLEVVMIYLRVCKKYIKAKLWPWVCTGPWWPMSWACAQAKGVTCRNNWAWARVCSWKL